MHPTSSLTIHTKKPPVGVLMDPTAVINGHPVPLRWGENVIPAPPGIHNIEIYIQWLWKQGKANITVDNSAGHAPPVYYAMPYTAFNKGAIGFEPQQNPGLVGFLLLLGVPILVVVLCCLIGTLTG